MHAHIIQDTENMRNKSDRHKEI